ncbi:MAG: biotin transporter BioY [Anaerolineae bacterium]|nr:biotin transporter BioY [Anaerolineae bacterium]
MMPVNITSADEHTSYHPRTSLAVSVSKIGWGWLRHIAIAIPLSYLLALSAQVRAPVPFSPVPVTAQTLVVLLAGALLPRPYIWSSFGLYLLAGSAGLPYFAGALHRFAGSSLMGPTGGYLVGFVVGATAVSLLMEKGWGQHPAGTLHRCMGVFLALLTGNVLIYLVGLPWLALFVGLKRVLMLGFLPFVIGDLLKLICALCIVLARNRLWERRGVAWTAR